MAAGVSFDKEYTEQVGSVYLRLHHAQQIEVRIQDNGRGFVVGASTNYEPGQGGFGLLGIAERARILGAQIVTESAPGQGTTIRLEIPIKTASRSARGSQSEPAARDTLAPARSSDSDNL